MLAMYNPPPFVSGCSQAALRGDRPRLVRNYDYDEGLFEGVVLASRFGGHRVVGTNDQLWGLLDGMNEAGLAISLAFGGRRVVGDGFGVPLILRYVLETCRTLAEAGAALSRLPVQVSYTVLVVDREGRALTAFINPDRPAELSGAPASTNHQRRVEWPEHDRLTHSVARALRLRTLLADRPYDPDRVVEAFLRPPLRSTDYARGAGTLYTAEYRPADGRVTYRWPGSTWSHTLDGVVEGSHIADLTGGGPR
jgi:predicted choloylglycine hydrolase